MSKNIALSAALTALIIPGLANAKNGRYFNVRLPHGKSITMNKGVRVPMSMKGIKAFTKRGTLSHKLHAEKGILGGVKRPQIITVRNEAGLRDLLVKEGKLFPHVVYGQVDRTKNRTPHGQTPSKTVSYTPVKKSVRSAIAKYLYRSEGLRGTFTFINPKFKANVRGGLSGITSFTSRRAKSLLFKGNDFSKTDVLIYAPPS